MHCCVRPPVLMLCAAATLLAQASFYEEDLQAWRPYREPNYRQFPAYVSALEHEGELRLRFMKTIGYPAPGFFDKAHAPRIVKAGEDGIGTYFRMWIPVAPQLETYGLYIVPKEV